VARVHEHGLAQAAARARRAGRDGTQESWPFSLPSPATRSARGNGLEGSAMTRSCNTVLSELLCAVLKPGLLPELLIYTQTPLDK